MRSLLQLETGVYPVARKANPVRDDVIKTKYLEALEQGLRVRDAAAAAGVTQMRIMNMRKADPLFGLDHEIALALGAHEVVNEAYTRAMEGRKKYLWHMGKPVMVEGPDGLMHHAYELVYSDAIIMRILEARDPETWDGRVRAAKYMRRWAKEDGQTGNGDTTPLQDALAELDKLAADKASEAST